MVRRLLQCPTLARYERHARVNCCCVFPAAEKKHGHKFKDDACGTCNTKRFHVRELSGGGVRLKPR
eukprot:28902-Chlamydomonas_euryale.AAC.1